MIICYVADDKLDSQMNSRSNKLRIKYPSNVHWERIVKKVRPNNLILTQKRTFRIISRTLMHFIPHPILCKLNYLTGLKL